MEALEPNMYVRTDLGNIGKIVEEYTHQNNKVSYPEPQEWVLDTGYILNEAMTYKNEEITTASHNIIDLIEVGDYVNGYPVYETIDHPDNTRAIVIADDNKSIIWEESSQYIKSIVTKEMFESMKYEVK